MGKRDPRIDVYIAKAAPFAKPILKTIRERVHAACPDVVETLKWSSPSFEHKGLLCGMAAFKEHATFGFWKHDLVMDGASRGDAMGSFGKLRSVGDLPPEKSMAALIRKAVKLNEDGVATPRKASGPAKPLKMPPVMGAALKKHARAARAFDAFSTSKQNEYIEWIAEAKTDATRDKRLAQAIEWIAEGKSRNWKYER